MAPQLIDTEQAIKNLLTTIEALPEKQYIMFLDVEGVNLSRHGAVAILQILIPPNPTVYLVDVHVLGKTAFTTIGRSNHSLQSILESPEVAKVFFDVRNDSDALHHHFNVKLQGTIDLQILEFLTRSRSGEYLSGLAKCIERDLTYSEYDAREWRQNKELGAKLFRPEQGGSYQVFLDRPLSKQIVNYCEGDVMLMPALLVTYGRKAWGAKAVKAQLITDDRIAQSQRAEFCGKGQHMARGPSLWRYDVAYDAKPSFPMSLVVSSSLKDLCKLEKVTETEPKQSDPKPSKITSTSLAKLFKPLQIQDTNAPRQLRPGFAEEFLKNLRELPLTSLASTDPIDIEELAEFDENVKELERNMGEELDEEYQEARLNHLGWN